MPNKANCKYCQELYDHQSVFKSEVKNHSEQIDPESEQDWFSLTLGWALGRGMSIDDAHDFALHIRYHTHLG